MTIHEHCLKYVMMMMMMMMMMTMNIGRAEVILTAVSDLLVASSFSVVSPNCVCAVPRSV